VGGSISRKIVSISTAYRDATCMLWFPTVHQDLILVGTAILVTSSTHLTLKYQFVCIHPSTICQASSLVISVNNLHLWKRGRATQNAPRTQDRQTSSSVKCYTSPSIVHIINFHLACTDDFLKRFWRHFISSLLCCFILRQTPCQTHSMIPSKPCVRSQAAQNPGETQINGVQQVVITGM
jgi:hypothetical protein